jgi:hypothetical protein
MRKVLCVVTLLGAFLISLAPRANAAVEVKKPNHHYHYRHSQKSDKQPYDRYFNPGRPRSRRRRHFEAGKTSALALSSSARPRLAAPGIAEP